MKRTNEEMKKRVAIFGAGLVTKPLVHYLHDEGFYVLLANRGLDKAKRITEGLESAEARQIDVEKDEDQSAIDELVASSDAVVSMLPYIHHPLLAKVAIKHKKNFFTTSYVSEAMEKLEAEAKEAGILMLNECGVDPGTDHMSACRVFDRVHKEGGKITSFLSFAGGLPAPEANDNPLGYKFSWAPRGVLLASRNTARHMKDGEEVVVPGEKLFTSYTHDTVNGVEYECYPNRDSVKYLDIYSLRDECKTIMRGTYRHKGWCDAIKTMADLGFLSTEEDKDLAGASFADILRKQLEKPEAKADDLKNALKDKFSLSDDHHTLKVFSWLGLFSDEAKVPARTPQTRLDALCDLMMEKMAYKEGERDMMVMQHTFVAEFPEKKLRRTMTTRLIDYGIKDGDSSMSRTVSYPVGIVIKKALNGDYEGKTGIFRPLTAEFYNPVLDEMEKLGIRFEENVEKEEQM